MKIKKKLITMMAAVAVMSTFAVNAYAVTDNVGGYVAVGTSTAYGAYGTGLSYVQAPTYMNASSGVFVTYYSYDYVNKKGNTQYGGSGTIYAGAATKTLYAPTTPAQYATVTVSSGHSWTCNGVSKNNSSSDKW